MSAHRFWQIVATQKYIDSVKDLPLGIQDNIQKKWMEISTTPYPRTVGNTDDCGTHAPFVLAVFPGIAYEFVYEIKAEQQEIWLISCKRLTFLDHGQPD